MPGLEITRRDLPEEGVSIIELSGVLDGRSTEALEEVMQDLAQRGRLRVVVNCADLTHLSSDGMGIFLSHLIKIRKQGGDIKFCAMRQEVRAVLSLLGLSKLLVVNESEDEAIESFQDAADVSQPKKQDGEKLRVEVTEVGGVAVVGLFGFVDRHTIALLDSQLQALLDAEKSQIVIDCSELTYISSNGMGVFISYVSKAHALEGDIRLCCVRDIARTVITMLGLHRLFQVFETREAALESFA